MQLQYFSICLLVFSPWLVRNCSALKILMISMAGTKSHKIPLWELAKGLIERNHSLVLLSHFPPDFHMPGLEEVASAEAFKKNTEFHNRDILDARLKGLEPFPFIEFIRYITDMCSILLESREVQEMIHSGKKFDLLIVDAAIPDCAMGLVYFYKVPFIYINSVPMYTAPLSHSGSPVLYSVTPFFLRPNTENMNLVKILRKHFGSEMPDVHDLRKNVSFILQNGHFSITYPRPYLPNVAEIACIHCRSANPLNKEMEDFINKGGENGFIVMSLGGSVKMTSVPAELLNIMFNTFSKLPQQILLKWEDDTMIPDMPHNIMLSKWLPQQDLLGHKKIRAFVTHCGMQSIIETVYHGVPVVCIPLFADQDSIAVKVQQDGYGILQSANQLSSENFLKAITDVIHIPKYRIAVKERQFLLRDQKEKPVDKAIYWIEYALRHERAQNLLSPLRNLNVIQYYSIDSFVILMGVALFLIIALGWLLKTCLRYLMVHLITTPEKTKEN